MAPRAPFPETANAAAYVPREATEARLRELRDWSEGDGIGSTLALLIADPGMGKTQLLRVFESGRPAWRRGSGQARRGLFLPHAGLSIMDLCEWVHGLMEREPGIPDARDHPVAALAALFALAGGPDDPLFLLVDDADSMPLETARVLAQGLPRERSPLRFVLAMGNDARASRLRAILEPLHPVVGALRDPLDEHETAIYLRTRLARAGFDSAEIARFDRERIRQIHALAGGVPRRIHQAATAVLESERDRLPVAAGSERDRRGRSC
ncbi:MAG TPA: hypothetical protein ENI85_19110 [Deltaproteobacteria bacterium]|nr:hypothetical protein [Deltaproteobacteria bacterium]